MIYSHPPLNQPLARPDGNSYLCAHTNSLDHYSNFQLMAGTSHSSRLCWCWPYMFYKQGECSCKSCNLVRVGKSLYAHRCTNISFMAIVILSFPVASLTQNLSLLYEYDGPEAQSHSAPLWEHSQGLTSAKEARFCRQRLKLRQDWCKSFPVEA